MFIHISFPQFIIRNLRLLLLYTSMFLSTITSELFPSRLCINQQLSTNWLVVLIEMIFLFETLLRVANFFFIFLSSFFSYIQFFFFNVCYQEWVNSRRNEYYKKKLPMCLYVVWREYWIIWSDAHYCVVNNH